MEATRSICRLSEVSDESCYDVVLQYRTFVRYMY